jgi:CDGSH-type Zn-finger protein
MTQDSLIQDSMIYERREATAAACIVVIRNGPYELDGSIALVDHLGIPIAAQAPVRLCRCGQSQTKPFCDDSHLSRGFTDNKDPRRVADKLDVYEGQQAYVHDNRGTCAHSGFCTDRYLDMSRAALNAPDGKQNRSADHAQDQKGFRLSCRILD